MKRWYACDETIQRVVGKQLVVSRARVVDRRDEQKLDELWGIAEREENRRGMNNVSRIL